jgi:Tfp pilus assembly protein PilX
MSMNFTGNKIKPQVSERGVALIFALLATAVLAILAAAVMITAQGQTWTALNYRLTTQSRYAAEAGVQSTMNWLSSSNYKAPTNFASYDMTKNPVQYNGSPVVLSAVSGVSSNYPDATVSSAYSTALGNQALPGLANVTYSTYATLLRMNPAGGVSWMTGTGGAIQTWQITSVASIGGATNAAVQVVSTYERTGKPIFSYPIEATGTDCGSITFSRSGSLTDSYNSANGPYSATNSSTSGGDIATNGNVNLGSGVNVDGTIYVPTPTTGACPGNGITGSGKYTTAQKLANTFNPALPWGCTGLPCYPPANPPLTTAPQNVSTACAGISGCKSNGTTILTDGGSITTANVFTLTPGSYGNVTINGADVIHVSAGTYNINSINFAQDGQIVVDSGPVVFNIVGNCASGGCPTEGLPSPFSPTEVIYGAGNAGFNGCSGGVTANPDIYGKATCGPSKTPFSGIPNNLQIVYGGTNTLRLGGMPNAAVLYAPSAGYYTPGAPVGLFGSAVVQNFRDDSGSPFHYDNALQNSVMQVGQYRPVGGFAWSKF